MDFDEFCHWLETGERVLNSHGIMKSPAKTDVSKEDPPKGEIADGQKSGWIFNLARYPTCLRRQFDSACPL